MFRRHISSGLIVAMLFIIGGKISFAVPILDQPFDPGLEPTLSSGIDFDIPKAQTFTVGIAGTLTKIDIDIARQGAEPLLFDLRATRGAGVPIESDTMTLAALTIPTASIPITRGFFSIDISTFSIDVMRGDVLAIVLRDPTPGTDYVWFGGIGDPYILGAHYFRNLSAGFPTWTLVDSSDVGFKTFIEPIPEPSPLLLLGLGLGVLAGFRGKRLL